MSEAPSSDFSTNPRCVWDGLTATLFFRRGQVGHSGVGDRLADSVLQHGGGDTRWRVAARASRTVKARDGVEVDDAGSSKLSGVKMSLSALSAAGAGV
jgi:hypothetical protein